MNFKEQELILQNQDSFVLEHIFDCGQCFRWEKQPDESYIGVVKNGVLKVSKKNKDVFIKGYLNCSLKDFVNDYFDLDFDYKKIKQKLSKIDDNLKLATEFGTGIRILKQDLWEMIISYIISSNNNIPRIKKIINAISQKYGTKVIWDNKEYYLFPTVKELSKATQEDIRALGAGFRDKYIYKTTSIISNNQIDLDKLKKLSTDDARNVLKQCQGIGDKVADCILLFGMHRFDVYPVDVWVRRVTNELYIHNPDENKVKKEDIINFAFNKFGDIAGLAQQYLFYYRRENNKG